MTTKFDQYIADVMTGKVVACEAVRLACCRHIDDLDHAIERGIYFDKKAAARAISFIERLPQTKGKWSGQLLVLEPWESFIVAMLFGWKNGDHSRRFRKAYIEVARKNGKTTLLAAIQLYMLYADGEQRAEVYSVATTRDQAKISFDEAVQMVRKSGLRDKLEVWKKAITCEATGSKLEPLSSDADTLDGLNPSCAGVDEYHAHKDSSVYDSMINGMGARRQPLIVVITTAGTNQSGPCYAMRKAMMGILRGTLTDPTTFAVVYTLDSDEDFDDPKMWVKANPNVGVSVSLDFLEEQYRTAKNQPDKRINILIKNFNTWTQGEHTWISDDVWSSAPADTNPDDLLGKECWAGLDLSNVNDITAFNLLFHENDSYQLLSFAWLPAETMAEKVRKDNINYDVWARQGYVYTTEGNVVDYDYVRVTINTLREKYRIHSIAYDRYNASQLIIDLQNDGATCNPFGQGFVSMSAPTKQFQALVLTRKLVHFGNPLLRWQMSNVAIDQDPAGNIKVSKRRSGEKVDNVVAAVMALGEYMTTAAKEEQSNPYAHRGLLR